MTGTVVLGVRVPSLSVLVFLGMAVVMVGVGWVTGGFMLLSLMAGVAFGTVLLLRGRRRGPFTSTMPRPDPTTSWPATDPINASAIRVAGVGGLGLVAMAAAVAADLPMVRASMLLALAGGIAGAFAVIVYRRRKGPLSSADAAPRGRTFM